MGSPVRERPVLDAVAAPRAAPITLPRWRTADPTMPWQCADTFPHVGALLRAAILASATAVMPHDPGILSCLFPLMLWHAACSLSMAASDVWGVIVPEEGSPLV
jgi:hypothetical protein